MQSHIDKIVRFFSGVLQSLNGLSDKKAFWGITGIYFLWRILTAPTFEISGDAVWKWSFLRYFHETGVWFPAAVEHHQGRWAQNLPVYGLMELFQTAAPWLGMVVPVLTGFVLLLLVWRITRHFTGQAGALGAVFLTLSNPVFINESAQLLPSLPVTMYILLSFFLLLKYLEKPSLWFMPLLAGLSMGLAWGCKVTCVYWAAGMGLFLLFNDCGGKSFFRWKRFRLGSDALLLALGFLLVFIPETLIINSRFDLELGRIAMLHKHHGGSPLFQGFTLPEYIFSPFVIFLGTARKFRSAGVMAALFLMILPLIFFHFKAKEEDIKKKFLFFVFITAMLIHCYLVVKVFPFMFPERPLVRYFLPLFCVWYIAIVSFAPRLPETAGSFRKVLLYFYGAMSCFLLVLSVINLVNDPIIRRNNISSKIRAAVCVSKQKKENLPVLVRYDKKNRFSNRTVRTIIAYKIFWGDHRELPLFQEGTKKKLIEEWQKSTPVTDIRGRAYFQLSGPGFQPGVPRKALIVDEEKYYLKKIECKDTRTP